MNIEEWSVFARELNNEITTKQEFKNKVSALKKKYPEFHWNMVWDEASWKAEAAYSHVENNVTEFIRIVTTEEHNNYVTYIIYEVKGTKWNEESISFLQTAFQNNMNGLFQENPSVFSCVKGSINDNMNSVFAIETEKLLNLFKAKRSRRRAGGEFFFNICTFYIIYTNNNQQRNQCTSWFTKRWFGLKDKFCNWHTHHYL